MTCEWGAGALAALPRAPATWNDGVDGALLCDLLFSLHDDRRRTGLCRSWLCYLPVTLRHPRPRQAVRGHVFSTAVCHIAHAVPAPSRFCYFT